jgi:integrase
LGICAPAEFTTKALNDYIEKRKKLGRKNGTINRELAHLLRAFRLGFQHDPQLVYRLPVIKALKEDNVREGFLEPENYRLILESLTEEIKPVFVVAYHLGMRTGELLALKRSWVDLEEGLIYVKGRVTKNREPKTAPIYGDMGPWLEMPLSRGQVESPKCVWLFARDGKPIHSFKSD